MKMRLFPLLRGKEIKDIDELNALFWEWLERDCHRCIHSALNMTPLDKYLSQMSQVKLVENPGSLKEFFLRRVQRKVRHDGTISLHNTLFAVPPVFVGQKIELRCDEGLKQVFVFKEGKKIAEAKPVNLADNARAKRERPALSFAELKGLLKGEGN